MARNHAVVLAENLKIPRDAFTYDGFQRWLGSAAFPRTGRIDFLAGDVEVEMSPEDLQTHGTVKLEIGAKLHLLVRERRLGQAFVDRTRVTAPFAGLSAEPDVVVVLWESLEAGRVRYVGSAQEPGRSPAIIGTPDLVVEIVSRSSERKDTKQLPALYARAGIPELWLVDARGGELRFRILRLAGSEYADQAADADGWLHSPRLGHHFRLRRDEDRFSTWQYTLDARPS